MKRVTAIVLSLLLICSLSFTAFAASFEDVSAGIWFEQAVEFVSEKGLMSGTGNNRFSPGTPMSRAMLAAVLYRLDGSPAHSEPCRFTDVPQNAYYRQAVAWAAEQEIVSGIGGGRFAPERNISRQDLAVMLYRYGNHKGYALVSSDDLSRFSDQTQVAGYARQAMEWAVGAGILQGDAGKLMPTGSATRAQVAVMLMRFLQNVVPDQPNIPSPTPIPTPAPTPQPTPVPEESRLLIRVNGQRFYAELYDNESAKALEAMLPLTLDMQELNGNEKYYFFDNPLPTNASRPAGIHIGDLMLYGNNCLVLFYKDFTTSYSYTPLGRLDDPTGLAAALGAGSVTLEFSLAD